MRARSHEGLQGHRGLPRSEGQGLAPVGTGPTTRRRRVTTRHKRRHNGEATTGSGRNQEKAQRAKKDRGKNLKRGSNGARSYSTTRNQPGPQTTGRRSQER